MRRTMQRRAQRGYTMVELMVALAIAMFLMGGLVTLVMHTRNASTMQSQMQQLQENERIAMTILANVIQESGYFPDPTNNTSTSLAAETDTVGGSSLAFLGGQAMAGLSGAGAPGDAIGARFVTPIKDASGIIANTIISCAGTTNSDTGATHVYSNVFRVATVSGTTYLQCILSTDGANPQTVNLVPGLYDMQVLYGVATGSDTNVTQYIPASSVTNWGGVTSVKVRLYFQLPNYGFSGGQVNSAATSGAVAGGTQYVERVIDIMNRTGVNT